MSILVTGSTGFIGSRLCMQLAREGHRVHALYRSRELIPAITHPNIIPFKGDILDLESLETAIRGCSQVFHTAAFTQVWAPDARLIYQLNVTGTLNILETALKHQARDVVITSTAGVLGPSRAGQVDEFTEPLTTWFTEYERTKAIAEKKALEYINCGLNIRLVSPTRVFGPGRLSQSNSVTRMIRGYYRGSWRFIPGKGDQTGNYAFIDDVVKGHLLAMQNGKTGENYILGGHDLSYNEFFAQLEQITGRKRTMLHLPLPVMMMVAKAAMLGWSLASIPPFITPELVQKFNHHWLVSSQKAVQQLGYSITPIGEALRITLETN